MKPQKVKQLTCIFLFTLFFSFLFNPPDVKAATSSTVNATVKISVCGNSSVENGENCEGVNLVNQTCQTLGYSSGTLSCDISCSFDKTSCLSPVAEATSSEISYFLNNGLFIIPDSYTTESTPSITTNDEVTIKTSLSDDASLVVLPEGTIITEKNGENINPNLLSIQNITSSSLSGFTLSSKIEAAIQWGIANKELDFSDPVTLKIFAGASLNGETLNILRSTTGSSGWTTDGLVDTTCKVANGICSFRVNKASYFATSVKETASTSSSTSTTSSSSSTSSSTSNSSSNTTVTTTGSSQADNSISKKISSLPFFLMAFDLDKSGRIELKEIIPVLKLWVNAWRKEALEKFENNKKECDFNFDDDCTLTDFSVLLFYIEK